MRCFEVLWIRQEISFLGISSSSSSSASPTMMPSRSHTFVTLPVIFTCWNVWGLWKPTPHQSLPSFLPFVCLLCRLDAAARCRRLHKAPACGRWVADGNLLSLQRSCHRRRHTSLCLPQPCLGGDQELLHSANTDGGFSFFCFLSTTQLLYFFIKELPINNWTLQVHNSNIYKYLCIMFCCFLLQLYKSHTSWCACVRLCLCFTWTCLVFALLCGKASTLEHPKPDPASFACMHAHAHTHCVADGGTHT